MKKRMAILMIWILLLAGCGRGQDEAIPLEPGSNETETSTDTTGSMIETESGSYAEAAPGSPAETVPDSSSDTGSAVSESEGGADLAELYVDLEKTTAYIAEGGRLILDNDGFLYPFVIDTPALGGESSEPQLVFGEAYEETRYNSVVTLVPVQYSTEEETVLLGVLHGNHFEPNSEYFDEGYLLDGAAGESICGFIDSISGDMVSVFAGEAQWLHQDTYMELVNVSETPIDLPLAEGVRYVLLDQNFRSVEVTAARFQKKLEQYEQKEKPAGPIFYLNIVDDEVVRIWEHFNP